MRFVGWICFTLWTLLLTVLVGFAARVVPFPGPIAELGAWTPDAALVLLLALCARLERTDARIAATIVALVHAALGADSPFALLAGTWLCVEFFAFVHTQLNVEGRFVRALLCGALAATNTAFVALSAILRAPTPRSPERDLFDYVVPAAIAAFLLALLVGRAPRRLPGLKLLFEREESWAHAAPAR